MIRRSKGGMLVTQIKQLQDRVFAGLLKDAGIEDFNGPQGRILYVLWQRDGRTIREICDATSLAKTTLTGMLDRMEEQGHILRVQDVADRRKTRIGLTPSALAQRDRYRKVADRMTAIFYQGFDDRRIQSLDGELQLILDNLKSYEKAQP